ncbi:hypothetical protein A0H81_01630 [Grifola frondosa]|uniref:Uncharacterized protein n=1 Tax=Grifola frondosa TaxID=5627 RepID=A0A1C7MMN8_GRIFR|nr:hypothetical protein A0H81_01630 [Grifola frondosa]
MAWCGLRDETDSWRSKATICPEIAYDTSLHVVATSSRRGGHRRRVFPFRWNPRCQGQVLRGLVARSAGGPVKFIFVCADFPHTA